MNLNNLIELIKQTRRRRRVIITFGVMLIIALFVLVGSRFVIEQVSAITDFSKTKHQVQTHIEDLKTLLDDSRKVSDDLAAESSGTDEFRDLMTLISSVENTIDTSSTIISKYSVLGSTVGIADLKKYDERISTLTTRLKNVTDNLSLKVSDKEFVQAIAKLKEVVTTGTRFYAESSNGKATEELRQRLLSLTQKGTDLIRTDISKDTSDKTALKQQVNDLINEIQDVSKILEDSIKKSKEDEKAKAEEEAAAAEEAAALAAAQQANPAVPVPTPTTAKPTSAPTQAPTSKPTPTAKP